jgi:predicted transposase YbfD/YdcC
MYEGEFFKEFKCLDDKRQEGKVRHKLIDVMFLVISAVISGCNEWEEIHMWATAEQNILWLKKYIELLYGIPSVSTIKRIFNMIDPKQLEKSFIKWMKEAVKLAEKDIIPIDGKTMKGTARKKAGKKGLHIVTALCKSNGLVLGQVKTAEKSNEITAIPELLDMLYIKGCIVTIDAMGAQRDIARKIVKDNEADYVLSLKSNQETLNKEVKEYFHYLEKEGKLEEIKKRKVEEENICRDNEIEMYQTLEKGHGRIEKRTYYHSTDIDWMQDAKKDWEKLTGIGMVVREVEENGEKSCEHAYFIDSIDNVKDFEKAVRGHWGIESVHWSLDVTFRDDANQTKDCVAAQNMAVLKRMALNTVRNDTERYHKKSMRKRRFAALMDSEYRDYLIEINFKQR